MKSTLTLLLSLLFSLNIHSQVYKVNTWKSLGVSGIAITGGVIGLSLMDKRADSDTADVLKLENEKQDYVSKIDVKSKTADQISDFSLGKGILIPIGLYAFKRTRAEGLAIGLMYLETMSITGMTYALSAGLVDKYRPYAYSTETHMKQRLSHRAKYSFFAGHVAIASAGSFFTAKVFSDLYPESRWKYAVWGLAGVSSAACAYYRYYKGYHFPEDIIIGIGVGVLAGVGIPALHKIKNDKLSVSPILGPANGIALSYKL